MLIIRPASKHLHTTNRPPARTAYPEHWKGGCVHNIDGVDIGEHRDVSTNPCYFVPSARDYFIAERTEGQIICTIRTVNASRAFASDLSNGVKLNGDNCGHRGYRLRQNGEKATCQNDDNESLNTSTA